MGRMLAGPTRTSCLLGAADAELKALDALDAARALDPCRNELPSSSKRPDPRPSVFSCHLLVLARLSLGLTARLGPKFGPVGLAVLLAVPHDGASAAPGSREVVPETAIPAVAPPANTVPERMERIHAVAGAGGAALPAAIEKLRAANAQVVPLGTAEGLRGFLVRKPDGDTYAAYVTATGAVAVGLLIGSNGEDVTRRQLAAAAEAGRLPDVREPAQVDHGAQSGGVEAQVARLVEGTKQAGGFWIGDRGPVIHVFADPTCPYSVEHVRGLSSDARAGKLRAHVIPVGVLGERSAQRAVEIAGAAEPRRAWETGSGGTVDRAAGAAEVAANMRMHSRWRVRGVPFSIWEGREGARVYYGAGVASAFAADVVSGG